MKARRFEYKTNIVWLKVRKDGWRLRTAEASDSIIATLQNSFSLGLAAIDNCEAGCRMVNVIATMKQRHSQKPDELYDMIEHCSPDPFLELFARTTRRGWVQWGDDLQPVARNFQGKGFAPSNGRWDDQALPYASTAAPFVLSFTRR